MYRRKQNSAYRQGCNERFLGVTIVTALDFLVYFVRRLGMSAWLGVPAARTRHGKGGNRTLQ